MRVSKTRHYDGSQLLQLLHREHRSRTAGIAARSEVGRNRDGLIALADVEHVLQRSWRAVEGFVAESLDVRVIDGHRDHRVADLQFLLLSGVTVQIGRSEV